MIEQTAFKIGAKVEYRVRLWMSPGTKPEEWLPGVVAGFRVDKGGALYLVRDAWGETAWYVPADLRARE